MSSQPPTTRTVAALTPEAKLWPAQNPLLKRLLEILPMAPPDDELALLLAPLLLGGQSPEIAERGSMVRGNLGMEGAQLSPQKSALEPTLAPGEWEGMSRQQAQVRTLGQLGNVLLSSPGITETLPGIQPHRLEMRAPAARPRSASEEAGIARALQSAGPSMGADYRDTVLQAANAVREWKPGPLAGTEVGGLGDSRVVRSGDSYAVINAQGVVTDLSGSRPGSPSAGRVMLALKQLGATPPQADAISPDATRVMANPALTRAVRERFTVAPPFYSQAKKVVGDPGVQETQTGEQWQRFLTDPKRGVKAEEMKYTGLAEMLASKFGQRVGKGEIEKHLDENAIEVKEITKAGQRGDRDAAKFSQYTLPGAENYREVLLTLPAKERSINVGGEKLTLERDGTYRATDGVTFRDVGEIAAAYGIMPSEVPRKADQEFRSGHWYEFNVIAHLRLSDRTVGGKRTLLVEELQSDWGQKGRKEGFALGSEQTAPMDSEYRALVHKNAAAREAGREPDPADVARAQRLEAELIRSDSSKIPQAPFVTDTSKWTTLALKRLLKMAADEGYDAIGIVPGVEQAKRYDLSKQISKIRVSPTRGTPYQHGGPLRIEAFGLDGENVIDKAVTPQELPDIIGKEMAEKVVATGLGVAGQEQKPTEFSGLDLQVGGEGMKGYYDKIVPETLNKLAKEYGVKVQIEGGGVDTSTIADVKSTYAGPELRQGDQYAMGQLMREHPGLDNARLREQLKDVMREMSSGKSFKEAMESQGSIALAEALGGSMKVEKVPVHTPIHTLDIPEPMRKQIKRKGFPLYSRVTAPSDERMA